jgi:hypothetical protein
MTELHPAQAHPAPSTALSPAPNEPSRWIDSARPTAGPAPEQFRLAATAEPSPAGRVHAAIVDGQRFRLPRALDTVTQLHVVAIGTGWCELSELTPPTPLPAGQVCVDERRRFRLPDQPGIRARWANRDVDPVVVLAHVDARTGAHHVLLLALDRVLDRLGALRPDSVFPSRGTGGIGFVTLRPTDEEGRADAGAWPTTRPVPDTGVELER